MHVDRAKGRDAVEHLCVVLGVFAGGHVRRDGGAFTRGTTGGGVESAHRGVAEGSPADGFEAVAGYARAHADTGCGGGDFGHVGGVRALCLLDGDVFALKAGERHPAGRDRGRFSEKDYTRSRVCGGKRAPLPISRRYLISVENVN